MTARDKQFENLSAYLDGELSAAEVERVEQAVAQDSELAAELASLRKTRELVRALSRQKAPDDFVNRVLQQAERTHLVHGHAGHGHAGSNWARWLATAAAVLVVAGLGGVIAVTMWKTPSPDHLANRDHQPEPTILARDKTATDDYVGKDAFKNDRVEKMTKAPEELAKKDNAKEGGAHGAGAGRMPTTMPEITLVYDAPDVATARRDVQSVLERRKLQTDDLKKAADKDKVDGKAATNTKGGAAADEKYEVSVVVDSAEYAEVTEDLNRAFASSFGANVGGKTLDESAVGNRPAAPGSAPAGASHGVVTADAPAVSMKKTESDTLRDERPSVLPPGARPAATTQPSTAPALADQGNKEQEKHEGADSDSVAARKPTSQATGFEQKQYASNKDSGGLKRLRITIRQQNVALGTRQGSGTAGPAATGTPTSSPTSSPATAPASMPATSPVP